MLARLQGQFDTLTPQELTAALHKAAKLRSEGPMAGQQQELLMQLLRSLGIRCASSASQKRRPALPRPVAPRPARLRPVLRAARCWPSAQNPTRPSTHPPCSLPSPLTPRFISAFPHYEPKQLVAAMGGFAKNLASPFSPATLQARPACSGHLARHACPTGCWRDVRAG
jgi:hypothetical protein